MASVTFAVRGNSLTARRSSGGSGVGNFGPSAKSSVVTPGATTGLIGTKYIDMYQSTYSTKTLFYNGGLNLSPNKTTSILMRCCFNVDALQGVFVIGSALSSLAPDKIYMYYNSSTLNVSINGDNGGEIGHFNGSFAPTLGRFYDILLVTTGDTTTNGTVLYVDGSSIATATLTGTITTPRDLNLAGQICLGGITFDVNGATEFVNEFCIFDYVVDPANASLESGTGSLSGQSRTSFCLAPALDAQSYTDPGPLNVANGLSYVFQGVTETGSLANTTNNFVAATLVGQSLKATLVETIK